jgi:hypothetical protein
MPLAWASKTVHVDIPTYDKISDIEHKNGKRLVNTREKNDETHEIKR